MIASEQKSEGLTEYATPKDFYRIFSENIDHLYLLSLLLTADDAEGERCFLASLEDCTEKHSVFKEWAYIWCRRAIIKNAIRTDSPVAQKEDGSPALVADRAGLRSGLSGPFAQITHLQPFERFVYVISILEGYSDQECSLLLNCRHQDVTAARIRVLSYLPRIQALNSPAAFGLGMSIPRDSSSQDSQEKSA
jgi:hypothetical protein